MDDDNKLREDVTASRTVFTGRLFNVRVDDVALSDGQTSHREIVEHPGAVAMVPLLEDGRVVLVKQYRRAADEVLLEIPAGTLHPGEDIRECARRELREEIGYTPGLLTPLTSPFLAPGYSSEQIHIFLATQLSQADGSPDLDERLTVEAISFLDAVGMVWQGKIRDAKSVCGLLMVAFALQAQEGLTTESDG